MSDITLIPSFSYLNMNLPLGIKATICDGSSKHREISRELQKRQPKCHQFTKSAPAGTYILVSFFFSFCCAGSLLLQVDCLWLQRARASLHCSAMASHCSSFSCCRAQALGPGGSVVWLLRAYLPLGMWNSLRPWIEPVSLTVTGRFLTVGPPGKF